MTASHTNREPLSPIELERLYDSLDDEGKEILTNQMLVLNNLTSRLQQLHVELLEQIDKGDRVEAEDFGGLCISFSEPRSGETWSQGIGATEPVCNAFIGTFHSAWKALPEEIFDEIIELTKERDEVADEQEEDEEDEEATDEDHFTSDSSPIINLEKWKVDNRWKN